MLIRDAVKIGYFMTSSQKEVALLKPNFLLMINYDNYLGRLGKGRFKKQELLM